MKQPTLVILAAGMASRYGALKQIDAMGNNGEAIIEFSIYDAYRAGFKNVVIIIKKEHESLFEQHIGSKVRKFVNLQYAYQELDKIPKQFQVPNGRVKPWGTIQALLCAKDLIPGPFMSINADDFYGPQAYQIMFKFLTEEVNDKLIAMVGYQMSKTLTDAGAVTRALCENDNGYLTQIVEMSKVIQENNQLYEIMDDGSRRLIHDGPCSMNMWGYNKTVFDFFEEDFINFLTENINKEKSELVIPVTISRLIKETDTKVKIFNTKERWFGVTYQQDKEKVRANIQSYKDRNIYPFDLWQ